MPKLNRGFFIRPTTWVAQNLLGKVLVHKFGKKVLRGIIIETEAYVGPKDRACHAFGGKRTKRTQIMFEEGGRAYPYFVYGMHWLFNITTGNKNVPEAVLIRALDIENGNGPAKLAKVMKLDGKAYGCDLCKLDSRIYVEDVGIKIKKTDFLALPRIGVGYAGPYWAKKKWRFLLKEKR